MKYEYCFNPVRKVWAVWRISFNGSAEVVKQFKSESSAKKYCEKMG